MALVLHGEVEGLVPLVEEDVEQDGSEDQPGLQETVLGVLVVAAHHGHLGCPRLLQRQLLDVLDVVDLVGLLDGGVGHLGGVQVLGVHRHARQAGPEDVVLDEPAELAGVLPVVAGGVVVEDGGVIERNMLGKEECLVSLIFNPPDQRL